MYRIRTMLIMSLLGLIYSTTECTFNADPEPPASPENLVAQSGDTRVDLTWDFNREDDFEGYNLYKAEQSIADISDLEPLNGLEELYFDSTYVDTQVENGTTYYYRITAVDLNGNESEPSVEMEVTPFTGPPTRPKNQP